MTWTDPRADRRILAALLEIEWPPATALVMPDAATTEAAKSGAEAGVARPRLAVGAEKAGTLFDVNGGGVTSAKGRRKAG